MSASTSRVTSSRVTATAPDSAAGSLILAGPRVFATRTTWPAALSLRVRVAPILPAPMMPILNVLPFPVLVPLPTRLATAGWLAR